ncbi:DUF2076 domain-containing protein [Gallaecimonas pentaromativorans]|uniref:Uncharacterized protein DUF2076 n=1 Tax=Gallaecimonas pentaromativorans TaxID=584787 RepID=A0A3N1PE47_9GAMM|nr:DUF2076 family protein [Gallaecimonas pentaromativorans]ROQ29732.1 uncharacterized protein DUF2076 [Gallaecimonas pentaromativorans]
MAVTRAPRLINASWGQRAPSFLGGALQTAAGVAGGVVIGDMLMNMFSHHNPTEIVDIIDERPASDPSAANNLGGNDAATDPGNSGFDNSSDGFQNQDNGVGQDNGFGNDDYGNDDFGGFDDDSFF